MPELHAFLSASASKRWIECPPSAMACSGIPDEPSVFALQGTDCHELCAYKVEKALGKKVEDPTPHLEYYDEEMEDCAEQYCSYVLECYEEAKKHCDFTKILIEHRLDFSRWVPDGFGTGDCVIVADDELQIIDYKHGLGVEVSAGDDEHGGNTQMMCYALGALSSFEYMYDIKTVRMTIFQPRKSNISTYEVTKEELLHWANTVLAPKAKLAIDGKGEFKAGPHCQFCKIKATCRKRAEQNLELAKYDFRMPDKLTDLEISAILEKCGDLVSWVNDVKDYALAKALEGTHFDGWKVVEGRSVRKFTDENAATKAIVDAGFDPYEKKLKGITTLTKMLGTKKFQEVVGEYVYKPPGSPALVPESDKRPEYSTARVDFNGSSCPSNNAGSNEE